MRSPPLPRGLAGSCYPELEFGAGSDQPFGFNHTHHDQPMSQPWTHFTAEQLGANPGGIVSAAIPSMRLYETDGFVAVVIPFFSDTFLPEQRDLVEYITDYRDHYVNTTNGRTPKWYCVRLSQNGREARQLCDPTTRADGTGQMTGVVRAAVEEMWNDLKRGHFVDSLTRTVVITLQLKSNHLGVRYRITLMFELTSLGTILPSYDVETRIMNDQANIDMMLYANISLVTVLFFAFLELIEMMRSGIAEYASDLWNVMDWINFFFFFLTYMQIHAVSYSIANREQYCSSYMCTTLGYFDDWRLMKEYRMTKMYISLCVCIQLFKVIKFTSQLVPKMSLMTSVLRECVVDLAFFGLVFFNSVIAFSMMLYVQLGPVMEDYYDQIHSLISLFRALFGDFDIDEIMNNSSGYLNTILFLGYLFVAIFIMLSLFLAILAEAQGKVREMEAKKMLDPTFNEYGVVASAWNGVMWVVKKANPWSGKDDGKGDDAKKAEDDEAEEEPDLDEAVSTLRTEVAAIGSTVKELASLVTDLRTNPPSSVAPMAGEESAPAAFGMEEAKAMRKVVEALDAKLSRKLTQIDERMGKRDRAAEKLRNGTRSRPGREATRTGSGSGSALNLTGVVQGTAVQPPPGYAGGPAPAPSRSSSAYNGPELRA